MSSLSSSSNSGMIFLLCSCCSISKRACSQANTQATHRWARACYCGAIAVCAFYCGTMAVCAFYCGTMAVCAFQIGPSHSFFSEQLNRYRAFRAIVDLGWHYLHYFLARCFFFCYFVGFCVLPSPSAGRVSII